MASGAVWPPTSYRVAWAARDASAWIGTLTNLVAPLVGLTLAAVALFGTAAAASLTVALYHDADLRDTVMIACTVGGALTAIFRRRARSERGWPGQ